MQTLRKPRALLGPDYAGKWALLAVLAVIASAVEAAGARVVFALLTRIMDDRRRLKCHLSVMSETTCPVSAIHASSR
jgi:hypothetical protein